MSGRSWVETQCEWEIYRTQLLSLRAQNPLITFSAEVKKSLGVDVEGCRGTRYKALDDLLDGILCAYLAYYFWHSGDEGCWMIGNIESGYVALPYCRLPNCQLSVRAASRIRPWQR
jgi:predicted RNase H-like nuclease